MAPGWTNLPWRAGLYQAAGHPEDGLGDRPNPVPEEATNFGLIGQYVEVSRDVAFTIEYSARSAWEAIHLLLKHGPAPPPVYQAQYDLKALFAALKVFVCSGAARPRIPNRHT